MGVPRKENTLRKLKQRFKKHESSNPVMAAKIQNKINVLEKTN